LEEQGGDYFFGEPAFDVEKLIEQEGAKGVINILAADKLYNYPKLYSAFLMWLLNSLYSKLPEVGDMDKPKFIFFFDEAHLLFDDASKVLMEQIEKVVRLIRSKGVGVYFITQNPMDIPESVLGQLGNKIQHALRAFTPKDQKAVKKIAETFRQNEKFDTESTILELETGEALISFLDEKGAPTIVERAKMLCPQGQIGPLTPEERSEAIKKSRLYGVYENRVERESASEILSELTEKELEEKEAEKRRAAEEKEAKKMAKEREKSSKKTSQKQSPFEKAMTKMLTSLGRSFGTKLINAIVKKIK
jgi:DNA helicase HerA-like ATPase